MPPFMEQHSNLLDEASSPSSSPSPTTTTAVAAVAAVGSSDSPMERGSIGRGGGGGGGGSGVGGVGVGVGGSGKKKKLRVSSSSSSSSSPRTKISTSTSTSTARDTMSSHSNRKSHSHAATTTTTAMTTTSSRHNNHRGGVGNGNANRNSANRNSANRNSANRNGSNGNGSNGIKMKSSASSSSSSSSAFNARKKLTASAASVTTEESSTVSSATTTNPTENTKRPGLLGRIGSNLKSKTVLSKPNSSCGGSGDNSNGNGNGNATTAATTTTTTMTSRMSKRSDGAKKRGARHGGVGSNDGDDDLRMVVEEDPVMALFQERSKQRVRFALEGDVGAVTAHQHQQHHQNGTNGNSKRRAGADGSDGTGSNANGNGGGTWGGEKSFNIKAFMGRALFKAGRSDSAPKSEATEEAKKEIESSPFVWESPADHCPEVLHTTTVSSPRRNFKGAGGTKRGSGALSSRSALANSAAATSEEEEAALRLSFVEQPETRNQILKLLNKGRRGQFSHYRYQYAVKCFVKAWNLLTEANYPEDHPLMVRTLTALNNAHHALSSFKNSANIVKIGIKYEDSGELVRALKMYTIAYRIRRDQLSRTHPSLVVLLNILGSIQIKRGDLQEAMLIYELALREQGNPTSPTPSMDSSGSEGVNEGGGSGGAGGGGAGGAEGSGGASSPVSQQTPHAVNLLAQAVTYREMGVIHEHWGESDRALQMYHSSLDCISDWKQGRSSRSGARRGGHRGKLLVKYQKSNSITSLSSMSEDNNDDLSKDKQGGGRGDEDGSSSLKAPWWFSSTDTMNVLDDIQLARSFRSENDGLLVGGGGGGGRGRNGRHHEEEMMEAGEMEMYLTSPNKEVGLSGDTKLTDFYYSFFPDPCADGGPDAPHLQSMTLQERQSEPRGSPPKSPGSGTSSPTSTTTSATTSASKDNYADVDIALTLHQIGQMHRRTGKFGHALDAYKASLRGMRYALGPYHPNVAAILANIGNLQKESGDMDAAYETYQEVLSIESYRLGVSHPEVAVSLHNVATIEAARGNYAHALSIYQKVLYLQQKLFGDDHEAVAITAACMGDVQERLGDLKSAMELYEQALKVKTVVLGRHTLEVARLLHKLGKLSFSRKEFNLADSYISRAVLIYRLNRLPDENQWVYDALRDGADIDAAIVMGEGALFEC